MEVQQEVARPMVSEETLEEVAPMAMLSDEARLRNAKEEMKIPFIVMEILFKDRSGRPFHLF